MAVVNMMRSAVLSPDGTYRYELRRIWDADLPRVAWIMLNPSTADAYQDDATIRRCIGFADSWGYGGIVVRNLFALRATDPRELRLHADPVGPENDEYLRAGVTDDDLVMCAWGAHGSLNDRGPRLLDNYTECGAHLYHLGLTKGGAPRHPLYLPGTATPIRWTVQHEIGEPVVEHVTAVVPTEHDDGTVTLSRVDATIIGPSSIARPEAVEARRLLDEQDGGGRRG